MLVGLRKSIGKALLCTYQGKQQMHSRAASVQQQQLELEQAGRRAAGSGCGRELIPGFSLLELISKGATETRARARCCWS